MSIKGTSYRLNQAGDTIVEVLIAIAVVSMVLGGAYVTTNKSLQGTRAAEERGNAIKLSESQLEQLKAMLANKTDAAAIEGKSADFCITQNAGTYALPNAGTTACRLSVAGITKPTGEPAFNVAIHKESANVYKVTTRWNSILNRGQDNVQLTYRVYAQ